jgi:hypothetical protein
MNVYTFVRENGPPICDYCKRPMREWNPWASVHKHDECWIKEAGERMAESMKEIFAKHPLFPADKSPDA